MGERDGRGRERKEVRHSGPSSGNRQNIDSLHYSFTLYQSNLPKISELAKKKLAS